MDADLLEILVCPKSGKKLEKATPELLKQVNQLIQKKQIHDAQGNRVEEKLEEALVQPETGILYPIRDQIPVLLSGAGINVNSLKS